MQAAKTRRIRLNMRMPPELVSWAKEYALAKNTTITQLLVDYLTALRDSESFDDKVKRMAPRRPTASRVPASTRVV